MHGQDNNDLNKLLSKEFLNSSPVKCTRTSTFITLYFVYAAFHAVRTSWSFMKTAVSASTGYSKFQEGIFDTAFLITYALGLFYAGYLGDRLNLKAVLLIGMIAMGTGYFGFAFLEGILLLRVFALDVIVFVINGAGQATVC
jgi:sugar phosphate permease